MGRVYSLITLYNPDESVVKKSKQIAAQTETACKAASSLYVFKRKKTAGKIHKKRIYGLS